jgi:two-component sensor histidine kinase
MGRFTDRIQALAANQDLLIRNEWHGADVEDLVRAQLAHFADLIGSRIAVDGPKLHLNGAAAQAIGLALHELATNASKYGALSTDTGRVDRCFGTRRCGQRWILAWGCQQASRGPWIKVRNPASVAVQRERSEKWYR